MKYYLYRYEVYRDGSALKQVYTSQWWYSYQAEPRYFDSVDEAKRYRKMHGLSDRKRPCRIGELLK